LEVTTLKLTQVRGEKVERRRAVGMGHRRGQLCHLPEPHHGSLHRMPGQPGVISKHFKCSA